MKSADDTKLVGPSNMLKSRAANHSDIEWGNRNIMKFSEFRNFCTWKARNPYNDTGWTQSS